MADYVITSGDTSSTLQAALTYADGTSADLTGATVQMVLRNPSATDTYLTVNMTVALPNTVTYKWQAGDTAVAGDYVGEFVVTYVDGTTQHFPTAGYFTLTIKPATTDEKPRADYYTLADLIQDVRGYLDGRQRPLRNRLAADIDTVTETLSLKRANSGGVTGAQLCIGLETMYVEDSTTNTLTVERGADGTIPAQHKAGDTILINPEFTTARILRAINDELRALPGDGIYQTKTLDRTMTVLNEGYDLAPDVERVVDVRWQHKWDSTEWTAVESFEVSRNMPTANFPSGIALFIAERPFQHYRWFNDPLVGVPTDGSLDRALRIKYWANLGTLSSLFDDVLAVTGIPPSAVDIIAIGAACRLMMGKPIQRVTNLTQPDARNAAEVKASDVLNAAAALRQARAERVMEEADKLRTEVPYRKPARRLMWW